MRFQIGLFVFAVTIIAAPSPVFGGIYTDIDTMEDTPFNRDFRIFEGVLVKLRNIQLGELPKGGDWGMRHRYILIENFFKDANAKPRTFAEKMNYSAVLIRRGKAYEATQILYPMSLTPEYRENFLVWSQLGTAKFLSGNADFRNDAANCLKQALAVWPEEIDKTDAPTREFLKASPLPDNEELGRFRRLDRYLERLMRYRIKEELMAKKNKPLPETVDPIFVDEDSVDFPKPAVKFLDEKGEFEAGAISKGEMKKLPRDAIEIVEQLLMWMPNDARLLWLLGEVANASVMEYGRDKKEEIKRNAAIRSAYRIFQKLTPLENPPSFAPIAKVRFDALEKVVANMKADNVVVIGPENSDKPPPDAGGPAEWPLDWWRTVIAGFIAGLAVGMFSIWQLQEIRRRRQARA